MTRDLPNTESVSLPVSYDLATRHRVRNGQSPPATAPTTVPFTVHHSSSHSVTLPSSSIRTFTVTTDQLFTAGPPGQLSGIDSARQAVASLQGYVYQLLTTALAWVDIDERSKIYLEVAEDYLTVADQASRAVQVKYSGKPSSVTLNSIGVRNAIANFVHLIQHNPDHHLELYYLTTSEIGLERKVSHRINGQPALVYWQDVLAGKKIEPLRQRILRSKLPADVRHYLSSLNEPDFLDKFIARIHWKCGQPDIVGLRIELDRRLIVLGRELFHIPAQDVPRLCDSLIYSILRKCILPDPANRYLTRADLYSEIDKVTQTTVPRATADLISRLPFSRFLPTLGSDPDVSPTLHLESPWLMDGTSIPVHQHRVVRDSIQSNLVQILNNHKHVVLVGASGLGKSTLSHHAANVRGMRYMVIDFRDVEVTEAKSRLEWLFIRIASMSQCLVIFEDLNVIHDRRLLLALKRVLAALSRKACETVITCYTKPSNTSLSELGIAAECLVECTYFSLEETCTLISKYGGSTKLWGRVAYLAGSNGHPQLTHAFVSGRAADNWNVANSDELFRYVLSASEIDAVRDATRRSLLSFLPEPSRRLLYRLSFIIGKFNRQLALELGQVPPVIPLSGESLDVLAGSLIEVLGHDLYRVSPLASTFGRAILPQEDQQSVHRAIASHLISRRTINALDIDIIALHSLLGNYSKGLAVAAIGILNANVDEIEQYAEYLPILRLMKTDARLEIGDNYVSVLVRLAQFKLTLAKGELDRASVVAHRIFEELRSVPDGEARYALESMVILTVLCNIGVANFLDNWIHLLVRARDVLNSGVFEKLVKSRTQGTFQLYEICHLGALFGIGSANIHSVARLERIINDLDDVDSTARKEMLTPTDSTLSDHSGFVGGSWVTELEHGTLSAEDAALRYGRMAAKTQSWGLPILSSQCSIAQSVMLDEYLHDKDAALAVLRAAEVTLGLQAPLVNALVKVHWRNGEYDTGFNLFSESEGLARPANPVDAAFAFRIGAICAGRCSDWVRAEKWFRHAQRQASCADTDEMSVLAVALGCAPETDHF